MNINQKSAWIDIQLFQNWSFEEFVPTVEKFLRKSGLLEKAFLLLDNTPSHPATTLLQCEDIVVKFLPPNRSIVKSIDQRIIVSFKQNYQKNLLQKILLSCDKKYVNITNCLKNISMKDVIFWAAGAGISLSCRVLEKHGVHSSILCMKKILLKMLSVLKMKTSHWKNSF